MRKIILCLLCIALFASLTACKNDAVVNTNSTNTTLSTTVTADRTETSPPETTPLTDSLSFADYIQWLKDYAEKEGFLGVTNLSQSNVAKNPNSITYSCDYDENLVSLNISTENGKVALIYSTISPYTIIDKGIASDMSDAQMIAYSLALEPIVGVNDEWDHSWHLQQFEDAQEQGDSTSIMRTYTKDNWSFTVIMGNALVSISALDNSIMSYTQTEPEKTQPEQTETTESAITEPVQTAPMNDVPYTTSLAGSTEIYKEPDSSSKYVQDIGKKGVFTIVKEAYDSSGNLWGKLKSGLGWVLLKKEAVAPARTCSQCGMAEPDTYFADDWQEGDLCDACNYDNFNAGDEKLICKSCGEDCTYIGLEEDGRCEDCHSK